MLRGPRGARDLPVGDVPHEHMPERVLRLTCDRRALARAERTPCAPAREDALRFGRAQRPRSPRAAPPQNTLPTTAASWTSASPPGREEVEPGRDDPLHGLRQRELLGRGVLGEHAHVLLCVERVAARAREQRGLRVGREDRPAKQGGDQSRRLLVRERRQREGRQRWAFRRPSPAAARAARGARSQGRGCGTPRAQSTR